MLNSDVFPFGSVAVAVMAAPAANELGVTKENVATPLPFVVTVVEPRNLFPSP